MSSVTRFGTISSLWQHFKAIWAIFGTVYFAFVQNCLLTLARVIFTNYIHEVWLWYCGRVCSHLFAKLQLRLRCFFMRRLVRSEEATSTHRLTTCHKIFVWHPVVEQRLFVMPLLNVNILNFLLITKVGKMSVDGIRTEEGVESNGRPSNRTTSFRGQLKIFSGAAIAQWIRLRLPSCRPWVQVTSTPSMLSHWFMSCEKDKHKLKRGRDWPIFKN